MGSKRYRFELQAVADACTDTVNCMNITNGYVLEVELQYDGNSMEEITLTKITKTEDGVVESFDALKGVYHFAGNNWNEVYDYEANLILEIKLEVNPLVFFKINEATTRLKSIE